MPVDHGAKGVNADKVENTGSYKRKGRDNTEFLPVQALGGLFSLLRNGIEPCIEEGCHDKNRNDAA